MCVRVMDITLNLLYQKGNDDVPVFMVMDDHAEAEPRRKKDKHNFIVVSNNTIN